MMFDIWILIIAILSLIRVVFGFSGNAFIASVALLVILVVALGKILAEKQDKILIKKLYDVTKDCANGRFESRVTLIKGSKILSEICEYLNNCIDHLEAFSREASTIIKSSQEGKYYRYGIPDGLNTTFKQNIEGINDALSKIEINTKESIKNALAKNLMNLNLNSQNTNLDYISNDLNEDLIFMRKVNSNIKILDITQLQAKIM